MGKIKIYFERLFNLSHLILLFLFITSCNNSQREKDFKKFDEALRKESISSKHLSNYKTFVALQKKYIKLADQINYKEGKALCYINLANLCSYSGNFNNAAILLKKAEVILQNSKNASHLAIMYSAYSVLNRFMNLYDNGLYYNDRVLYYLKRAENSSDRNNLLSTAYRRRGELLYKKSKYNEVLHYFNKARYIKGINKDLIVNIDCLIADFHTNLSHLDSASVYINKVQSQLKYDKGIASYSYHKSYLYYLTGKYYIKTQKYKKAETALQIALKFNDSIKPVYGFPNCLEIYKSLMILYQKTGDKKQEDYYTAKYHYYQDFINNNLKVNINQVIDIYTEDIIDIETGRYKNRLSVFFLVFVIILCVMGFVYYKKFRVIKKLKHDSEVLKNSKDEKLYNEVIRLAKSNDINFLVKFTELYPEFIQKLFDIDPSLEKSELIFCAFIKLNFSLKEIATFTFVLPSSVQQRRRRLRRKFNIDSDVDLYEYFNSL